MWSIYYNINCFGVNFWGCGVLTQWHDPRSATSNDRTRKHVLEGLRMNNVIWFGCRRKGRCVV